MGGEGVLMVVVVWVMFVQPLSLADLLDCVVGGEFRFDKRAVGVGSPAELV